MPQYTKVTGHDEVHEGLRGHSIGDYYPCVVEHFGDGSSAVRLGEAVASGFKSPKLAYLVAEIARSIIDSHGYLAAEDYLTRLGDKS